MACGDGNDNPVKVVDQKLIDGRREAREVANLYNERFNTHHVPSRYDGSHIALGNASLCDLAVALGRYGLAKCIQEGTAFLIMCCGREKTMACRASIMESKRGFFWPS